MPPNFSGLEMPSRPRSPAFLNSSRIGKRPSFSHSSTCGLISLSTKFLTVRRSSSCSWVKFIVVVLLAEFWEGRARLQARHTEGVGFERANLGLGADVQQEAQQLAGIARVDQAVVP